MQQVRERAIGRLRQVGRPLGDLDDPGEVGEDLQRRRGVSGGEERAGRFDLDQVDRRVDVVVVPRR